MVDLASLWPDNFKSRPRRKARLTIILDIGAGVSEHLAVDLQHGISLFDRFVYEHAELRHCVEAELVSRAPDLSKLRLQIINAQPVPLAVDGRPPRLSALVGKYLDETATWAGELSCALELFPHRLLILTGGGQEPESPWAQIVEARVQNRSLSVIPVIVGDGHAEWLVSAMGPCRPPLRLRDRAGRRLFTWLQSELLRSVRAKPGMRVALNVAGIADWAEV